MVVRLLLWVISRVTLINALAETMIGLFKTEVIHHGGPWRTVDDVEYATLEWVAWFNTTRLLAPLRYVPLAEYDAQHVATPSRRTVVDPSTGVGYKHPGVNSQPYPLPFNLVHTGMRLCVTD